VEPEPDEPEDGERLYSHSTKLWIVRQIEVWKSNGKPRLQSPYLKIMKRTGCTKDYPMRLYNQWLKRGSLEPTWGKGRPRKFSTRLWKDVVEIIREARARQQVASSDYIRASLTERNYAAIPSARSIRNWKQKQGFKVVAVKTKPFLSHKTMQKRLAFAKEMVDADWTYLIWVDEKWFSEEKPGSKSYEARPSSPVPAEVAFEASKAETSCQRIKIMYLSAVSPRGRVMMLELNWKEEMNKKSIDSEYWSSKVAEIHAAAVALLGSDHPIGIVLDNAPSHKSRFTKAVLSEYFDPVIFQSPSSPDFNMLDAGVFPCLERKCNEKGARTKETIREAVDEIWPTVTSEFCGRVAERVRNNMRAAIKLKGGNFYHE
jgi:hypothetical protein